MLVDAPVQFAEHLLHARFDGLLVPESAAFQVRVERPEQASASTPAIFVPAHAPRAAASAGLGKKLNTHPMCGQIRLTTIKSGLPSGWFPSLCPR